MTLPIGTLHPAYASPRLMRHGVGARRRAAGLSFTFSGTIAFAMPDLVTLLDD